MIPISQASLTFALAVFSAVSFMAGCHSKEPEKKPLAISTKTQAIADTGKAVESTFTHPYLAKADSLNEVSAYDSAIYYYKQAATQFEKEENWKGFVWANNYIGHLYINVRGMDYKMALPYLNRALKTGLSTLGDKHPFLATTYYYLGLYHYNNNAPEEALDMLDEALKRRLAHFGDNSMYVARVMDAIGDVYTYIQFDNILAEEYYGKSLRIKEQVLDKNDPAIFYSYYNLISIHQLKGDYEKAQSYCFLALSKSAYLRNNKQQWVETLEGLMADIYKNLGQSQKAIAAFNKVIITNKENNGDKDLLVYYYNNLGIIYSDMKDDAKAMAYFRQSIDMQHQVPEYGLGEVANAYQGMGLALMNTSEYAEALSFLRKCLSMRLTFYGNKNRETAIAYQHMGKLYTHTNQIDSALFYYQKALIAGISHFNETDIYKVPTAGLIQKTYLHIPEILAAKASVLKRLYSTNENNTKLLKTALDYFCLADTLMSMQRKLYERETSKLAFAQYNLHIYEEAIDCARLLFEKASIDKDTDNDYLNIAFRFIDKNKSSVLFEELSRNVSLTNIGIDSSFNREENRLKQNIYYLQTRLDEENSKETPARLVLGRLHGQIHTEEKKVDSLHQSLFVQYPYYAFTRYDTMDVNDLTTFSKHTQSVIIEYFWGDSAVYVLGIGGEKKVLTKLDNDQALEKMIALYRQVLMKGYTIPSAKEDFRDFQQSAFYIYDALVKPTIEKVVANTDRENIHKLVIIPDGPLSFIPFESLITSISPATEVNYKNLPFLLQQYTISYDYAANFISRRLADKPVRKNVQVLAVSYSKDNNLPNHYGQFSNLRNNTTSELPGSAWEVQSVASIMEGKYYMGEEATESKFKTEAPHYSILHLALHGESDTNSFYNSRLLFKTDKDSLNDGSLHMYELIHLKLDAELAVLSACESGVGKLSKGEGVYSIARGFVYAGCPSVIMSLWKVNDIATAGMMANFYQAFSAGQATDEATRTAKLSYIQQADHRLAHPVNWASFVNLGNTKLNTQKSISTVFVYGISIIILGIVSYVLYRFFVRKRPFSIQ